MLTTYLFLILATCAHLILDLHKEKNNEPIMHWLSASVAVGVSCLLGLFNQLIHDVEWYRFAIYSMCIHFALFDYLWNFFNNKPLFYHGEPSNPHRAWTDSVWDRIPPQGEILFRSWMLGVGISVYHFWYLIVGK